MVLPALWCVGSRGDSADALSDLRKGELMSDGACKFCTPKGGVHEDGCPFKVKGIDDGF